MTRNQVLDSEGARKADLAAIHIAKAELGWDESFYRSILMSKCGVGSAGLLDFTGRKRFLEHLRACGWSRQGTKGRKSAGAGAFEPLSGPQRKIWSLWQQLADAGLVDNRKMPALTAWLKRHTGVDRVQWLNAKQQDLAIEGLKAWLHRKADPAKASG